MKKSTDYYYFKKRIDNLYQTKSCVPYCTTSSDAGFGL